MLTAWDEQIQFFEHRKRQSKRSYCQRLKAQIERHFKKKIHYGTVKRWIINALRREKPLS